MRDRVWVLAVTILFVSAFLYPRAYQEGKNQRTQKDREFKSLIRKDLLETSSRKLLPPRRDIFTRQSPSSIGEGLEFPGADRLHLPEGDPSQTNSSDESIGISLDLKYIGYVNSEQRVVALILFRGEVYAVEFGDMLDGGISIGEITPDDIEIIGPDFQSSKVKLEGEKP
ncbi:MAG: hypothetical protein OEY18_00070 [Candidatus Aminicenantes bacterium]|nr:hypothetical protein [Candidatus Aminicenantes bacterium]MDH5383072.1 hypothetical protein [Candidatus Aminicenantes bacterium]MDH5742835.1 hypothetical protein [Candidatus Aminicenantes bacterium]